MEEGRVDYFNLEVFGQHNEVKNSEKASIRVAGLPFAGDAELVSDQNLYVSKMRKRLISVLGPSNMPSMD